MGITGVLDRAKAALRRRVQGELLQGWWYLSDSAYRKRYRAEALRIRDFRIANREAWPIVWDATGGRIASGPFAGMQYLKKPGLFNQKILGTYEKELAGIIEEICATRYDTIVDIGAAEGYYACGLALRNPQAQLVAFELQTDSHRDIASMARLNGLQGRVRIIGRCLPDRLQDELARGARCLVVCDVDGAEVELLDIDRVQQLRDCDILVEVHDRIVPAVTDTIVTRFASSHSLQHIAQRQRVLSDMPSAGISLPDQLALKAMDEFRGEGNDWLWMKRRPDSDRDFARGAEGT